MIGIIKKYTENHLKNDYASIFNLYLESMNGEKSMDSSLYVVMVYRVQVGRDAAEEYVLTLTRLQAFLELNDHLE